MGAGRDMRGQKLGDQCAQVSAQATTVPDHGKGLYTAYTSRYVTTQGKGEQG